MRHQMRIRFSDRGCSRSPWDCGTRSALLMVRSHSHRISLDPRQVTVPGTRPGWVASGPPRVAVGARWGWRLRAGASGIHSRPAGAWAWAGDATGVRHGIGGGGGGAVADRNGTPTVTPTVIVWA